MSRLKLIFNPIADRGHAAEAAQELHELVEREAQAASKAHGTSYDLHWAETEYHGHAIELASAAASEGFDAIVAIGGDGTVHEVINGLMQIDAAERPPLGVIPFGSGNDFAFNMGLPTDLQEVVRCLFGERIHTVDVCTATDASGRCVYWDNTIGIGFSGAVNIATRRLTRWRGFLLYLVAALETIFFKPLALKTQVTIDGGEPTEHDVAMISICNGPREGGGFLVGPGAEMDDGLITYVLMSKMGRLRMLRFVPLVMNGQHLQDKYQHLFVHGTAETISIKADKTMAIHADGELFGSWEADIREIELGIVPGAVDVLCNC